MKLQRFKAQKLAVKNGLFLGILIFLLNWVLTFAYLDYSLHTSISYLTAPLLMIFAGITGYQRMAQTKKVAYAIQSSILTVTIGLVIGFGTLYLLTYIFLDVVRNNPITTQNFQTSGQDNLDAFIYQSIITAITTSVPVSIILAIISGAIGAHILRKSKI